jgi:hypothetical protein
VNTNTLCSRKSMSKYAPRQIRGFSKVNSEDHHYRLWHSRPCRISRTSSD